MTMPLVTAAFSAWRAAHCIGTRTREPAQAPAAVVKLSIKALPDARTAETLGLEREGTGTLIGADGLILTIGYLILEAASILVIAADGRVFPALVVGFDHPTGFGLLRVTQGLDCAPIALGDSASLGESEQVTVCAHNAAGGASYAVVMARRRFAGYWEYMIDDAIFSAPPRSEHSGAALLDGAGRLVGIGSLWVGDALESGCAFPGNMFVPIDLLKPLLADLIASGRRSGRARPWLGVYTEEIKGHVVVTRVLPQSPAAAAGLRRGDLIVGVASEAVEGQSEFYRRLWAAGSAGAEIALNIVHGKEIRVARVRSIDRVEWLRPQPGR